MSSDITATYSPSAGALEFSDAAATKVKALLAEEENPEQHLRVYISGGGCSGFQYGFKFDDQVDDADTQVEKHGVKLLIDPMSILYLNGAEIDFQDGVEGARFVIKNPNAATTCGCGNSFSV